MIVTSRLLVHRAGHPLDRVLLHRGDGRGPVRLALAPHGRLVVADQGLAAALRRQRARRVVARLLREPAGAAAQEPLRPAELVPQPRREQRGRLASPASRPLAAGLVVPCPQSRAQVVDEVPDRWQAAADDGEVQFGESGRATRMLLAYILASCHMASMGSPHARVLNVRPDHQSGQVPRDVGGVERLKEVQSPEDRNGYGAARGDVIISISGGNKSQGRHGQRELISRTYRETMTRNPNNPHFSNFESRHQRTR